MGILHGCYLPPGRMAQYALGMMLNYLKSFNVGKGGGGKSRAPLELNQNTACK